MVKAIKAAKLADQLRDYLASWAIPDLPGYLFSITQVTLTPDLQRAIVWVDVLDASRQATIMKKLNEKAHSYQKRLHATFQRQIVPKIVFKADERPELSDRFDELLNQ